MKQGGFMWVFKGKYTGEAKKYIQKNKKRQFIVSSLVFSIAILLIFTGLTGLCNGELNLILIVMSIAVIMIVLTVLLSFLEYRRAPKCEIIIDNDDFQVRHSGSFISVAFYRIQEIDKYDDYIVIKSSGMGKGGFVLQKELLIEGEWDDLNAFLEKIEEGINTDEPIYQIEEPTAEFFEATVKSKRIYKRFVGDARQLRSIYECFATFDLGNGNEIEYKIPSELYVEIEQGQTGMLVLIDGRFNYFGAGEDIEQE